MFRFFVDALELAKLIAKVSCDTHEQHALVLELHVLSSSLTEALPGDPRQGRRFVSPP